MFQLINSINPIAKHSDSLVVDIPAGASNQSMTFASAVDKLVIVLVGEPTSFMDAYTFIKSANLDYNIQNFKTSYLKKISYIPQTFMIFPETISYNIAFKEKFTQQEITNLKKIYFICGLNKIEPIFENIFKKKLL